MINIIAECGCNWDNMADASDMIIEAKKSGCWTAKFQLFTRKEAPDLPEHLYLTKHRAKWLFNVGKDIGIPVFFTPMFLEAVDWCEGIGVSMYKIRYKDRENMELIEKVLDTGKPCFISIDFIPQLKGKQIRYLYCIPKYPATREDYGLPSDFWWNYMGISDHTPDTKLLKDMLFHRTVEYFEKHVKLDDDCLESAWSITFEQLVEVLKDE